MNRELAQRPTLAELNRVIGEQSLIMESLCSEHLLGRWIWKSGRVKGEKHAVPWNVQNINTNPVSRKPPTIRAKPRHVVRRAVRRAARYAYATLAPRLRHAYASRPRPRQENFVWEKDRCAITTVAPGLYEVSFGFFTRKKPSVP